MEPIDPEAPLSKPKPEILQTLLSGRFSSSSSALSARSRSLPTGKDFHFFHNFPDFKLPIKSITSAADSSLRSLSSAALWASKPPPPLPSDLDDALEWLVDLNDELLERVGASLDEFRTLREKEEEGEKERRMEMEEGGFQLVFGKKKKSERGEENSGGLGDGGLEVKVALKDKKTMGGKPKVPFHIPTIPRPQDEFNILVNNKNQPFQHVWLETSEDGSRFVHPLEKLSVVDFVDGNVEGEPVKPLPLESTPFKFVEGVKELKELAAKLRDANEFAVDLEHNHYRSFQGLTCLMQISTRTEDFIIDTLKLRVHIGPYLREAFKDPSKRKVMHGSDRDIVWLQRDFGIYVCNLFDTGQASRILQLERNSLEHLLHHFCGVNANKEYQHADWRLRPLPDEMVKYAREDTHYLLYIYDVMKLALLSTSSDENDLLLEVYKRSYDICMHLYEKELLTDSSYLYIYGLQEADFSPSQLAIVAGLCSWRDKVARDEDESTGYILPNKALLEIARQMPTASGKLRRMVKSKHPFVERHLNAVINIIRRAIENSSAFESVAEQLKKGRLEANMEADCKSEGVDATEDPVDFMAQSDVLDVASNSIMEKFEHSTVSMDATDDPVKAPDTENCTSVSKCQQVEKLQTIGCSDMAGTTEKETMGIATECSTSSKKVSTASVQMSVKPTSAFGAFLGGSSRRKLNPSGQGKNETKVEEIRSLVTLPFHSFSGLENPSEPCFTGSLECSWPEMMQQCRDQAAAPKLEEIIPLESDERDSLPTSTESPMVENGPVGGRGSQRESKTLEEHNSLSDLSSSFQQCFQSVNERGGRSRHNQRQAKEPDIKIQVKPFDYASARKNIKFGELGETKEEDADEEKVNKAYADPKATNRGGSMTGRTNGGEGGEFGRPRRSQAFPPTGNRSTMYH